MIRKVIDLRDLRVGAIEVCWWRMNFCSVTCPTCFESFEIALPGPDEQQAELDYDCEVCCRPMVIWIEDDFAVARGLGE